jgi:HK97 family phage portal protein
MSDYTQSLSLALRSAPPLAVEVLPKDDGVARREWQTRVFNSRELFHKALAEYRSSLENPQTPLSYPAEWLLDIFNGGRTDSGIRVSEMTALQVGTVLACVNLIGNGVAGLPLNVYEKVITDNRLAKRLAHNHDLFDVLANEPNPEMTRFTWMKTAIVHDLLWGNSYSEIQRDNGNQIIGLWPRNPSRTRPIRTLRPLRIEGDILPAGSLVYETTESLMDNNPSTATDSPNFNDNLSLGTRRIVLAEDMLHVPGLSLDGRLGQGPVYLARQIIGLSLATEKYAAKFFGNGARPLGILEYPAKMDELAIENLRRSWSEAHGGENTHKTGILEQGVKYIKVGSTPEEGQMLNTREFQRNEICSIFNVPPHMVGDLEKSARSNVEQGAIEFVLYCLGPWLEAYEQEFRRKLFPKRGRTSNKFFAKFDARRLMYPDAESRAVFYTSGKQNGYLNSNDIRELEDMNPIPAEQGGDVYTVQVNMQNATNLLLPPAPVQDPQ